MGSRSTLTSLSLFESVEPALRDQVRAHMEEVRFPAGRQIIATGDEGDALYVIQEGRVRVRVANDDGTTRLVRFLGAGAIFGEMALLTGEPRAADVFAADDCPVTCLRLPRAQFDGLLEAHPGLAEILTRLLDERVLESGLLARIGPYHVLDVIGRGQMASVFEGYHTVLRRPVAVKMLSHVLVRRPGFLDRFQSEAKMLAALRHPGIVRVHDACEGFGTWFIVMERLEGEDLDAHLAEAGKLDFVSVRRIVRAVAHALHHAHERGVIHRDVKPSNIFLDEAGRVRLVDFGVATRHGGEEGSEVMGTPAYVAPEVVAGEPVDARTDVYALGMTAFTLLSGAPAFEHEDVAVVCAMQATRPLPEPTDAIPGIPGDLAAFLRKATEKDPAERFQSCLEVLDHFEAAASASPGVGRERARIRLSWPAEAGAQARHAIDAIQSVLWAYEEVNAVVEGGGLDAPASGATSDDASG